MPPLSAPLVPAGVDLRDFAFMPLDVARLRDSDLAASETPECCWAAVLLWAAAWHQVPAGSIPNDDRWIAKQAGYAQRGKVAAEWVDVRAGALHGWVLCSDGRLYHPVVAEKARDAWREKITHRWKRECDRVRKENKTREAKNLPPLELPPFPAETATEGTCPDRHEGDLRVRTFRPVRDRPRPARGSASKARVDGKQPVSRGKRRLSDGNRRPFQRNSAGKRS